MRRKAKAALMSGGPPPIFVGTGTQSTNGTTLAPGLPAGLAEGDVMFLIRAGSDVVAPTFSDPSGWTLVATATCFEFSSNETMRYSVYRKVAGASESSPSISTSGVSRPSASIFAFRKVNRSNPVEAAVGDSETGASAGGTNTLPYKQITTNGANRIIVQLFGAAEFSFINGGSPGAGWTEAVDCTHGGGLFGYQVDYRTMVLRGTSPSGDHVFDPAADTTCRIAFAVRPT